MKKGVYCLKFYLQEFMGNPMYFCAKWQHLGSCDSSDIRYNVMCVNDDNLMEILIKLLLR